MRLFSSPLLFLSLLACTSEKPEDSQVKESDPIIEDTEPQPVDADSDGYTVRDGDCNDADADVRPLAPERCNALDDNCNALIDEGLGDEDSDGIADCLDVEDCDGIDNDGNGVVDDGLPDADADGVADCQDLEACDGLDNNGDGVVDEGMDTDADGYLPCGVDADCDDGNAAIHPGVTELSDRRDNDCDGAVDENLWTTGALVITEIMNNPAAVNDFRGEWFEAYNASDTDLYLNGLTVVSGSTLVLGGTDLLRLSPGEYVVIGGDDRVGYNGNAPVDIALPGMLLSNEAGGLGLWMDGLLIDEVSWDNGLTMPDPDGASMSLDPLFRSDTLNDDASGWCTASTAWGVDTELGTPGAANGLCPAFDHDGDGQTGAEGDCDDANIYAYTGADEVWYDGVDEDCDGLSDYDADFDGYTSDDWGGADCDDENSLRNPGAVEVCDEAGLDEDCNGLANSDDTGVAEVPLWHADADGDGYGDQSSEVEACESPGSDYTQDGSDCDDADATVNPDGSEVCGNGVDDDCNGSPDGCGPGGTTYMSSADYTLSGVNSSDYFGGAIGNADLNADGVEDLIVGAIGGSQGLAGGGAYVFYGPLSGDLLSSDADVELTGGSQGDNAGYRVVGTADVDGDGTDDMWVSAPSADGNSYDMGTCYLVSGATLASDRLGAGYSLVGGGTAGVQFGFGLDSDFDGDADGLSDLFGGAPNYTTGRTIAGAAFMVPGTVISGRTTVSSATLSLSGETDQDQAGYAVAAGGDGDGDGTPDYLVGAPGQDSGISDGGAAYFVSGTQTGAVALSAADGRLLGDLSGGNAGVAVDFVGDVDEDGYADVMVGAPSGLTGGGGAAYLVYGPFSGDESLADAEGILLGTGSQEQVGASVGSAGDVDGDGSIDLMVGGPTVDGSARDSGVVVLFYGGWTGTVEVGDQTDRFEGDVANAQVGTSVWGGLDLDTDGYGDLLLGASKASVSGTSSVGEVYVYLGGLGY
jgi:Putative metal-binding motif